MIPDADTTALEREIDQQVYVKNGVRRLKSAQFVGGLDHPLHARLGGR